MRVRAWIALLAVVVGMLCAAPALGTTVRDLARIKGQGEFVLRGQGLVIGLNRTGDNGKDNLAMIRALAAMLGNEGNQVRDLSELMKTSAVALVMVTATVPPDGARYDDRIDVIVSCVGNAKSLEGGELFLAPLRGPTSLNADVFAIASGAIELENTATPTRARVRGGARIVKEILTPALQDTFDLIIERPFSGYTAASQIAADINTTIAPGQNEGPKAAVAIDERVVRITIPENERADRSGFLAAVLSTDVNVQLLGLGAKVIYNASRQAIILTADVEISPVVVTQRDLNIATTIPAPTPTAQNPLVENQRWVELQNNAKPSQRAKLADLLAALKQLQVPVPEQINILQMLHKTGKLHAELVMD